MEDNKSGGNRNSAVLEGMYKGVAGKIDEVRQTVSKDLQYSYTQQAYAYESLTEDYKRGVDTLLAELRYISQQNSSIYDYGRRDRDDLRDTVLEALREQAGELARIIGESVNARLEEIREKLAEESERQIDYDLLADKLAERLFPEPEEPEESAEAAEAAEGEEVPEPETDDGFAYDVLAEKIASILPEFDYDLVADKVVAALPQTDADAVADKVVASLPQTDEHAIADHVAEAIPPVDYDIIAERVTAALNGEAGVKVQDESVERIARRVVELLREERPAEELAVTETRPQKKAVVPVVVPVPAPKKEEPAGEDTEMTTRYKRSFVAKIIESDEDIKQYYSIIKNTILSYGKVRSLINWTNDRFSLEQESLVKIGIRGKTLCVYLALDPSEFPETVYHQKFAGDTKMYEKTPMMIKIKSNVAVKRACRLIELLMERNGAVKEDREPVDYAAQYFFRTEEELLAEGLIKTAVVEKSDLNF